MVQSAVINKALLKQGYKTDYYFLKRDRDTQESPQSNKKRKIQDPQAAGSRCVNGTHKNERSFLYNKYIVHFRAVSC